MQSSKRFTILQIYSYLGLLASFISLSWLLIESDVRLAALASGISPLLILLILLSATGLVLFGRCSWLSWREEEWSTRAEKRIRKIFSNSISSQTLLAMSLYGLFFGAIFLFSIETRTDFRITPTWADWFIMTRSFMNRVEPLVFLVVVLCSMNLITMASLRLSNGEGYSRIVKAFALFILPILLMIVYVIEQLDQRFFIHLFKEDRLLEWLTFWFILLTGVISAFLARKARRERHKSFWFFTLFAVFFFFFAMEEISWGQRIFEIESPLFFLINSDQQEINAHNVLQNWGGYRTNRLVGQVLFVYGALLPFIPQRFLKEIFDRFGLVIPGRIQVFGFVLAALLMLPRFSGREEELGEFFFSICLLLFIILESLAAKQRFLGLEPEEL